jgi:hypothetical protein
MCITLLEGQWHWVGAMGLKLYGCEHLLQNCLAGVETNQCYGMAGTQFHHAAPLHQRIHPGFWAEGVSSMLQL